MNLDDMIKELEGAYWLTVHNKSDDYVRRLTFANYQFIIASYLVKGESLDSDYSRIHKHFYDSETRRSNR